MDQFLQPNRSKVRLIQEFIKHKSLTIGFDFDGTVHDFHKTGESYEMVMQLLRDLKEIGCTLICWTAYRDHEYVKQYCIDNNIPCDGINTDGVYLGYDSRKPFFSALLDDRAGLIQVYNDLTAVVAFARAENKDPYYTTNQ